MCTIIPDYCTFLCSLRNRHFFFFIYDLYLLVLFWFVLSYSLLLSHRCLFSNERQKGLDPDGRRSGEEMGGVDRGELIRVYCMKKESCVELRRRRKKKSTLGWVQLYSLHPGGKGQPELYIKSRPVVSTS